MSAREAIAKALAEYWEVPDQADGYELAAEDVEKALTAAGYVILSPDEVRGIRDEALEEAIKIASRHPGTKFTNSRGHLDWRPADNHDAAATVRSLKGGRDAQ